MLRERKFGCKHGWHIQNVSQIEELVPNSNSDGPSIRLRKYKVLSRMSYFELETFFSDVRAKLYFCKLRLSHPFTKPHICYSIIESKSTEFQLFLQAYPLIRILMSRKTELLYTRVLRAIRTEIAPDLKLKAVMCDFETAEINAIKSEYPEAQVQGCWFPFNQVCSTFFCLEHADATRSKESRRK